jgi:hypothetical protein
MSDVNIKGIPVWDYKELKARLSSNDKTLKDWFLEKVTEEISALGNLQGAQEVKKILKANGGECEYIFVATPYETYVTSIPEEGEFKHYSQEECFFLLDNKVYSLYDENISQEILEGGKVSKYLNKFDATIEVLKYIKSGGDKTVELKEWLIDWTEYKEPIYFYFLKNNKVVIPDPIDDFAFLSFEINESDGGSKNFIRDTKKTKFKN